MSLKDDKQQNIQIELDFANEQSLGAPPSGEQQIACLELRNLQPTEQHRLSDAGGACGLLNAGIIVRALIPRDQLLARSIPGSPFGRINHENFNWLSPLFQFQSA